MQIVVPPSLPYKSNLTAIPSRLLLEPREGNKQIPVEIDWGDYADGAVTLNVADNATLEFSQIIALKVDNSLCGATVTFIFPDTGDTIAIPAYSPNTVIEVFSQQTQFYVVATGPLDTDITRFQILNFLPPPISVSVSQEQSTAIVAALSSAVGATTPVIPSTENGTLEGLSVNFGIAAPAGAGNATLVFTDGNADQIAASAVFVNTAIPVNTTLLNLSNLHVRFESGLFVTVGGLLIPTGQFNINAYYRTP